MPTKNLRHGRIRLRSGDNMPLEKTAAFTQGDLSFTTAKSTIQILDRGALSHLRRGDQQAVTFKFSAKFVDRTLRRALEHHVFDGQARTVTGLTPQASNTASLPHAYEQGSLQAASGEAIATKLSAGSTPSVDGTFAETSGAYDEEGQVVEVRPGTFKVRPGAADTDMAVVYDAVGLSTRDPADSDRKTLEVVLQKLDVADPALATVVESYRLLDAYVESVEQAEGDEFDLLTFSGVAFLERPRIERNNAKVLEVEAADAAVLGDYLEIPQTHDVVINESFSAPTEELTVTKTP